MTKFVTAGSIKEGSNVVIDGAPCKVTNVQISRPGKHGHAKVRMEGVGIIDDRKRVVVMPGHDNVEVPLIEKKNAQILSVQGDAVNVMDLESFETFDLAIPEELKESCVAGATVLYWQVMGRRMLKQVKGEGQS